MSKTKILIVDDDPMYIDLAELILQQAGYSVIHSLDGPSALRKAETEKPDLIILDINMPIMSGLEVCAALKSNPRTKHIPIIIGTAREDIQAIEHSFEKGAVEYVIKPFVASELVGKTQKFIKKA